jgi:hypothetical protein
MMKISMKNLLFKSCSIIIDKLHSIFPVIDHCLYYPVLLQHGNIPNGLLPPAIPPLREFDPAFSLLLTNPPLTTMVHGTMSSSMSNAAVSSQPQGV